MTLNGAIMELVMLSEHPMMPVIFKPSMQKIIETVSECEEPERKTGRWERHYSRPNVYADLWWHCSVCGYKNENQYADRYHHFCPNCGLMMEAGNE